MDRHGPLYEQLDSWISCDLLKRERRWRPRKPEWWDAPGYFTGDVQRLSTGGQQAHTRAGLQEVRTELGARLQDVLGVVEDEQHAALGQVRQHAFEDRSTRSLVDAEYPCDSVGYALGVYHRREGDEAHPVVE
jgi:hypothetical protein